jgi:competence protein ComEC
MKKRLLPVLLAFLLLLSTIAASAATAPAEGHSFIWATDSPLVTLAPEKVMTLKSDINENVHGKKQDKGLFTVRYFLLNADSKSGDSILIHTPNDKFILIDAGVPESGPQLVKYLKDLGVTKLDAVFNTHPHVDHIGGIPDIVKNFPIGIYYRSEVIYNTSPYRKAMDALYGSLTQQKNLCEGDEIDFGGGVKVHVYNPPKGMDREVEYPGYSDAGKLNQTSLTLMFTYKDVKMLFVGDLYVLGEGNMIGRYPEGTFDADVVHCGHHGASTSSSFEYIEATSPTIAVMSTNGLQSLGTYINYSDYGSVVVANAVNGNLLITTDGTKASLHAYVEYQLDPTNVPATSES